MTWMRLNLPAFHLCFIRWLHQVNLGARTTTSMVGIPLVVIKICTYVSSSITCIYSIFYCRGSLEVRGASTTFPNRERAFQAWRHHCILFHDHPSDFVDGTVYVKTPSDSTTTLVFPSVDTSLYSPAKLKERSPKRSPKKPVKTLPVFPSDPIPRSISPAKMVQHCRTTNVAPVLTASGPPPDAVTSAQYPRRRWAIHTPRLNAIVNA